MSSKAFVLSHLVNHETKLRDIYFGTHVWNLLIPQSSPFLKSFRKLWSEISYPSFRIFFKSFWRQCYFHFLQRVMLSLPWMTIIANYDCIFLSCRVRASERITLYSCLNVKELLARSRRKIWSLSDCNWTRTHNHFVRKRTVNHLAKLQSQIMFHAS